jgi:HAD superfamily hydrolase (TIGR01509 family)
MTEEPVLLGSAMIGAAAAGRHTVLSAVAAMSALGEMIRPARGEIAAFHDRKKAAFDVLRRAEREIRKTARRRGWPEVVIFDCDGVLVDSEPIALAVVRRLLGEAGFQISDAETRERFLGMSQDTVLKRLDSELAAPLPPKFSERLSQQILAAFGRELKGIDGVKQAVQRLGARVCVASSSAPARIRYSLKVTGLEPLFAPNTFSASQVTNGKPHPDLFLFAARAMDVRPADCLVIEDSVAGVTAARAAGMTAFGFVGGSHSWGPVHAAQLTAAGAELIFAGMAELPDILVKRAARLGGERS